MCVADATSLQDEAGDLPCRRENTASINLLQRLTLMVNNQVILLLREARSPSRNM
jgi:hypothetical protein